MMLMVEGKPADARRVPVPIFAIGHAWSPCMVQSSPAVQLLTRCGWPDGYDLPVRSAPRAYY